MVRKLCSTNQAISCFISKTLCQFSVGAVTNHHKLTDLKQHTLFSYSAGGQKSEINSINQNHVVGCVMLPLDDLEENPFLASSSSQWLLAFLGFWTHHSNLCLCGQISLGLSPIKTLVIVSGPTHIIQDNLPISISLAESHLQNIYHIRLYLEVPELGQKIFEGHYSS